MNTYLIAYKSIYNDNILTYICCGKNQEEAVREFKKIDKTSLIIAVTLILGDWTR